MPFRYLEMSQSAPTITHIIHIFTTYVQQYITGNDQEVRQDCATDYDVQPDSIPLATSLLITWGTLSRHQSFMIWWWE